MVTYINMYKGGVWITSIMDQSGVRLASMKMTINIRFKLKQAISWTADCHLLEVKRIAYCVSKTYFLGRTPTNIINI
jgi:hypothetical protein